MISKMAAKQQFNGMVDYVREQQTLAQSLANHQNALDAITSEVREQQQAVSKSLDMAVREAEDYAQEYAELKKKTRQMLERNELPGVLGIAPELHDSWERLRVSRLNLKLMRTKTEAKE